MAKWWPGLYQEDRRVCTLLSVPHRNALKLLKVGFCGDSNTFKIVELSITNRIWRIWGLCQIKISIKRYMEIKTVWNIHRGNTFISYSLLEWKQTEGIRRLQGEEDTTEMMAHALGLLWELLLLSWGLSEEEQPSDPQMLQLTSMAT